MTSHVCGNCLVNLKNLERVAHTSDKHPCARIGEFSCPPKPPRVSRHCNPTLTRSAIIWRPNAAWRRTRCLPTSAILVKYREWVAGGGLANYLTPSVRELTHYLAYLKEDGLAAPSIARNLIATKMFYRFLRLEERVEQNTVELLSSPKLWERIPQVLSPESVEILLDCAGQRGSILPA